ncbi:MAG: DUF1588 domain-containing protein [Planctomycetales bacterium]
MRNGFVSFAAVIVFATQAAALAQRERSVLKSRCVECHNAEEKNGDVDLAVLLKDNNKDDAGSARLWTRVEKMVASRNMPPEDEPALSDDDRNAVTSWYRARYILRDGKDHIGPAPLRRLTRYELENTLEDLLSVKLKQPYVFSSESAGLQPSTIEQLYPADVPGESGFDNDADQLRNVKVPVLELMACLDFALRKLDQSPAAREKTLGFSNKPKSLEPAEAKRILTRFADRSSRGYHNEEEREEIFRVWEEAAKTESAYQALLRAMKAALLSPSFIYRMEQTTGVAEPYQVSASELAARLSYFLWSSAPDELLRAAAADGSLLDEEVLRGQIHRMLDSPKRIALSENFAGQWLGFDELKRNKAYYQGENWTRGVYDELLFGFDELIKSDRSLLEIVDSDWSYLRREKVGRLRGKSLRFEEKHADIFSERRSRTGLKVERFYDPPRLYRFEGDRVGGMLTSAGIMRLTSAPSRTNPIRRGVWLLENIIGEEIEPPENVPPLAESEKKLAAESGSKTPATPGEILKLHTSRDSCRACHQHIDPLGLGLENFSPNGDWRTAYPNKAAVVSQGVLPNGRKFSSPRQLKQELLKCYQEQIVDNMIRKMLSYAIGRKLRPHDRVTMERIHQELIANDCRVGTLIELIVFSKQFQCRQDGT